MSQIQQKLQEGINFTPAVVCFFVKDNQVLLGQRKKVSLGLGENLFAGIGGKVGDHEDFKDETFEQALIREAAEEIAVQITGYKLMGRVRFIYPHKPKWQQDVQIYVVHAWDGMPKETESTLPVWFDQSNLPSTQMWKDNAYWLPKVLAGEYVNAVFLFDDNGNIHEYVFE